MSTLSKINNLVNSNNSLNIPNTVQSLNSWLGHSSHCNSFKLQNKILNSCNFLINTTTYYNIEQDLISLIEDDYKKTF